MFQTDLFSGLCRTNRFEWFLRTVSTDELFSTVVFHDWFLKIFSGQIVRMKCKVMLRKNDFSRLLYTDQCLRTAFWIYFSEQLVKMNKSGKYVRTICFYKKRSWQLLEEFKIARKCCSDAFVWILNKAWYCTSSLSKRFFPESLLRFAKAVCSNGLSRTSCSVPKLTFHTTNIYFLKLNVFPS